MDRAKNTKEEERVDEKWQYGTTFAFKGCFDRTLHPLNDSRSYTQHSPNSFSVQNRYFFMIDKDNKLHRCLASLKWLGGS